MGAVGAVDELTAALERLRQKLIADTAAADDLAAHAKTAATLAAQIHNVMTSATYSVDALNTAMQNGAKSGNEFASTLSTILDIQTAIADGYQQRAQYQGNAGANDTAYTKKIDQGFQTLIAQAQKVGGPNSAIAGVLSNIEKELAGGIITPDEALQVLQGMLSGLEPGIISDIGNASTLTARNFAAELERILHGGSLPGA